MFYNNDCLNQRHTDSGVEIFFKFQALQFTLNFQKYRTMNDNNQFLMTGKAVFVLFCVLLLAQAQFTSDETKASTVVGHESNRPASTGNVNSEPQNDYDRSSYDQRNGQYRNKNGFGYNHNRTEEEINEEMMAVFTTIVVAGCLLGLALGGFIICRCMKRKNMTDRIKDNMRIKKQQFATQSGLSLFEVNGFPTIHV